MLAKLLTPYDFGVWSFIQLIIIYFSHIDFGVPSSFNTLAAIHKNSKKFLTFTFNAALTLTSIICVLVVLFFLTADYFGVNLGDKFNINDYLIYVILIIIFSYFNKLLINLFRIYNRLVEITFYQMFVQVLILLTYLFFQENLIYYLLISTLSGNIISFVVFIYRCPLSIKLNFSKKLLLQIQKSGLYFFIYNASFYFILLSTRSVVGYFYSVEEFGSFNFAFSIANIIELILSSFLFLIFPKMINRLANSDNNTAIISINTLQSNYIILVSLMSYLAITLFPIFIVFFPNYENSILSFNLILLTKLVYSNCYGSPILLIARKKERVLAGVSLFVLVTSIFSSVLIIYFFKVSYHYVILGSAIAYFLNVLMVNKITLIELKNFRNFGKLISYSFPIKQTIPFLLGLFFCFNDVSPHYYFILLVTFIILNYTLIKELKNSLKKIIFNPEVVDI